VGLLRPHVRHSRHANMLHERASMMGDQCHIAHRHPDRPANGPKGPHTYDLYAIRAKMAPMSLLTVGLNHHTAPLPIREAVAIPPGQFGDPLDGFLCLPQVRAGATLSTCNRSELYAIIDDEHASVQGTDDGALRHWLCRQRGLDPASHAQYFYVLHGRDVVRHSLRVAAGLDSMILGEPQILGQMKDAYRHA